MNLEKAFVYREIAKKFHRVEVRNGEASFFWFDKWSNIDCLYEKLGARGCIDLGILVITTVGEVMDMNRRRKHEEVLLNHVEEAVRQQRLTRNANEPDVDLWKGRYDHYQIEFNSKEMWLQIRTYKPLMEDNKGISHYIASCKKNKVAT